MVMYGKRVQEDLEFMYILRNHEDLKIVDERLGKLVLIELQSQICRKEPFEEKEEAQAKLSIILHVLRTYNVGEDDKVYINFHKKLRENI